jgi:hypothetical protein
LLEGSQTPASPQSTPVQGTLASTAPSDPPSDPPPPLPPELDVLLLVVVPPEPVMVALVVLAVEPPALKPPYCGKPHDAEAAIKVKANAAATKRKDRTIV